MTIDTLRNEKRATASGTRAAYRFLRDRLTDEQTAVLCFCLQYKMPVAVYGEGLGKSTLVRRLRQAGLAEVYAPEDCARPCSAMSVPEIPGAVALHVAKENSPGEDALGESFTDADLIVTIAVASERIR